jgi:uncharacterized membrane protein
MNKKNMFLLTFSIIAVLVLAMNVSAVGVNVTNLKINGNEVDLFDGVLLETFERGDKLDLSIRLVAEQDTENVQVDAMIYGYKYATQERELISDFTTTFDMDENTAEWRNLKLQVPLDADRDHYLLRVIVADRFGTIGLYEYALNLRGVARNNAVQIREVYLSPSQRILPGGYLMGTLRIRNMGNFDLDYVDVTMAIPELGISHYSTLNNLKRDTTETFEELFLQIPRTTKPGTYEVVFTVKYDKYESSVKRTEITVFCEDGVHGCDDYAKPVQASVINVPSNMALTVTGASFPITIENKGNADAVYSLAVSGITWGTHSFDPGADVIVKAGQTKTVYLNVMADRVEAGDKYFKLEVTSGDEVKEVALSITPKDMPKTSSLRNTLEIGLIILVVILIIIGLIIGFSKLKDNSKEDEDSETYY